MRKLLTSETAFLSFQSLYDVVYVVYNCKVSIQSLYSSSIKKRKMERVSFAPSTQNQLSQPQNKVESAVSTTIYSLKPKVL